MLKTSEIIETIRMINEENLDIRTITAGISLFDCADSCGEKSRGKIYEKITRIAEKLVKTGEQIEEGIRYSYNKQKNLSHSCFDYCRCF